ncbi:MAG: DUF1501 domain-containing protein, partial [Gemmataceae bacterium]|nr:DUF1501 domain-containing protein [Gemmataceae bacterium]
MSQFESWDPKPGTTTGGPFQSIQSSIPGYRMSELMPKMAACVHRHTAVIRSQLAVSDHNDATIFGGKPKMGPVRYPSLGSMIARELANPNSQVPHHVMFTNYLGANYFENAGFLGAAWNPINIVPASVPNRAPFSIPLSGVRLTPPANTLPPGLSDGDHREREALRAELSSRFGVGRERDGVLLSHGGAYGRVRGLMESARLFDIEQESASMRDRYGSTPFGQQMLVARRLIESGVPYVRVNRGWWDHHGQNFEFHQEMVPELDHVMSVLLEDLQERGLLRNTLVATFSEMGRTPNINDNNGRDHFPRMSVTLSGCGVRPGVVYGSTNNDGTNIANNPVSLQQFFATVMRAVGIDHQKEITNTDGRPVPLTDYGTQPIAEVLA